MKILAIETSCDETAFAILSKEEDRYTIVADAVASQINLHKEYGGVFPMMAKREHAKNSIPLLIETLKKADMHSQGETLFKEEVATLLEREPELLEALKTQLLSITPPDIDRIAVTVGPGLEPTLWVGINLARALSLLWDIPIVPVNHMEGHIVSVFPTKEGSVFTVPEIPVPSLALLVSGGHTELVAISAIGSYKLIGATRDDAVGEAFDKVARMLGLSYPGGPLISRYAEAHRQSHSSTDISFPRPMLHSGDFDFSFSGIKTAVLYFLKDKEITETLRQEVARAFEDAVVEVLVKKTKAALEYLGAGMLIVGGGVAGNTHLRAELSRLIDTPIIFPRKDLATDNAVMIGIVGSLKDPVALDSPLLRANGNLGLE